MQRNRLSSGGRIDRDRPLRFFWNGRPLTGYAGDTLASALLANGVRITARSFKYHRPRGIVGAGVEEPATLVELEGEAASGNRQATLVPLVEGLRAKAVNCWPSPEVDLGAVVQLAARLIPAGFYYKTFMWPNWHLFEPAIRKAAGLAKAPAQPPSQGRFEARFGHCDVLIAGAGPAGLMAALTAGRAGLRVFLADEGTEAGGSLLSRRQSIDGQPALDWVAGVVAELARLPNVTHLQDATVWAYREHNYLMVHERAPERPGLLERNWRIRAARVIVAAGALERSLVFGGNDRPGVMLASAAQAYVNRWGVRPGQRAVVFTNNDSAYAAAADLVAAGIEVSAVVDSRPEVPQAVMALLPDTRILQGHVVTQALGARSLSAVRVTSADGGAARRIDCDLLLHSGGWNPTVHLFSQSRGTLRYDEGLAAFVPERPAQKVRCVGAAAGEMCLPQALRTGAEAAAELAGTAVPELPQAEDLPYGIAPLWHVQGADGGKAFVDMLNDVTLDDVHLALREGYGTVEHVKRYTTAGMGLDQGKTGNVNVIGAIAMARDVPLPEVGTTTFRPPYTPVSFGAIGGLRADTVVLPYRHTPVTDWTMAQGGVMYESGARWRRPGYFPQAGESFQDTVNREARTVREAVGVYDGSPLGTFELKGRDVGRFLDHIYTNRMSTLQPGRCRYGLMLTDDGLIFDDGVVLRLSEHRWTLSTSTGNADAVNGHMEDLLQTQFPEWNVLLTTVTSQWNNATICGPRARAVMQALGTDLDLSAEALPFMSFAEGTVAGLPARVVRVSFTGELSFEVNVAPRDLPQLWERVLEAGAAFGIAPIGSEANHVLRVEKGFLSLGHEVDGTGDAYDLGLGWLMSRQKADFLGKRSVDLRRAGGAVRRELVGLLPEPDRQIPEGAPLTPGGEKRATEGLVTACVWSVVQTRWVALALLENGHSRHGELAHVRLLDGVIPVRVTDPVFHDPDGLRLRS
jgi:sarcosine oxidase subunit alpha